MLEKISQIAEQTATSASRSKVLGRFAGAAIAAAVLLTAPARAQLTVLHSFNRYVDGHNPYGSLIRSGSILFGTTNGGQFNYGSIFQIATDGTGFAVVRSFQGGPNGPDGAGVQVSLARSGSTMFGTTIGGGNHGGGTIFRMETDGTGFNFLHSFPDPDQLREGTGPKPLHLSGSTLYGMAGSIFRIGTDGSGYGILHSFERTDGLLGTFPSGSPIESGSTLYGMAPFGGSFDNGTVWRVGADGAGFTVLHSFAGPSDGFEPYGNLILSGAALYGMTIAGGGANGGTIFQIGIDGTGYSVLHSFAGAPNDGAGPRGSLIQSGSTLYGMTSAGGSADWGTIFQIDTDGTGFKVLHSFAGGPNDGASPFGDLLLSGATLYGVTVYGGEFGDGTIFSFVIPEPSSLLLLIVAASVALLARRTR